MKAEYLAKYRRYAILRVLIVTTFAVILTGFLFYLLDHTFNGVVIDVIEFFHAGLARFILSQRVTFLILAYTFIVFANILIAAIRYTRQLSLVIATIDRVFDEDDVLVQLPRQLKDVERKLNMLKYDMVHRQHLAREAEQRKNDLVVYLAHDLKTPLTSVIGYLSLLYNHPALPPELRDSYLVIALDKSQRLEDLINEFFEITRFNLQSIPLERSRINLALMLDQIADEFYPLFASKRLSCRISLDERLVLVGDGDKLARVFDNILRNAINYSYPNTEITIQGSRRGETLHLSFHNQGAPIPPHRLDQIFEKFFRSDTARISKTGGAGLGLAIAKEIVELHGGNISARSNEQETVFTLILPTRLG